MATRQDGHTDRDDDLTERTTTSRRRVLQLTGAGLLGTALGAGRAGASEGGSDVPAISTGRTPDQIAEDGPVGGGTGYEGALTREDADAVVASRGELSSALDSAASGDVVFVAGDARIDVGGQGFDVPEGVTLASNRGIDGAPGALLTTGGQPAEIVRLQQGARLTGIRLRGPHTGSSSGASARASGVTLLGAEAELDNTVVRGFAYAGVFVNGGDGHIHHNVIRECNQGGLGYGISMVSGHPVIEYNYFNYNRHSVATDGSHHGYDCRYNHFGPDVTSHVIDMHAPAGTRFAVHHNVVEGYVDDGGGKRPAVAVRGVPDDEARIRSNWFWNPTPPLDSPSHTWTTEAIIQPETASEWSNVSYWHNAYGDDVGVTFDDVIPGYTGWRAEPDRS